VYFGKKFVRNASAEEEGYASNNTLISRLKKALPLQYVGKNLLHGASRAGETGGVIR